MHENFFLTETKYVDLMMFKKSLNAIVTSYQNNDLQTFRNIRQQTERLFTNKL